MAGRVAPPLNQASAKLKKGKKKRSRLNRVLLLNMEETGDVCDRLHVSSHPVITNKIARLRDSNTKPSHYRRLLKEIALHLSHDATANDTDLLDERVSVFAIDRSGLSMADAMLEIVPHANLHFLGKCLDQCAYKLLTDMCLMSRCRCS